MIRANIKVNGIVQGVGFRPFIHKQITDHSLAGWIRNTSSGAEIEIEGSEERVDRFIEELRTKSPKLALIEKLEFEKYTELKNYTDFQIIGSKTEAERNTLISPDVCICDDCLEELFDPKNRRYRYPFINCTNCGPRFTIIKDVPYDRPKTTMGSFPMCGPCESEYKTITDRRYHAQPTCCPDCGPKLFYLDAEGNRIDGDPVKLAAEDIKKGKIAAVKGLGGIHLACRFDDPEIPELLRKRKHRDEKPFAIMCRDVNTARRYADISDAEEKLLTSFRRPIVLLKKKNKDDLKQISENAYVGIMLPYTPVHYLLMAEGLDAIVMTSANISELPIIFDNSEAFEKLKVIADGYLLNNRDIHVRCDDSLMYEFCGREYPVRRSRGYVPFPVTLGKECRQILACGAEQKATFTLSKGRYAFPSQHIGDLKNIESYENYCTQIEHFKRLYDIKPVLAVRDLHPDYLSSSYAEESALPVLSVQHHYAHMCSCMADNGLDEPVIGIVWDGTGLGTDGSIWGAEFLTGDFCSFERMGSIRNIRLPGGDKASSELWRTGISLLKDAGADPKLFYDKEKCAAAEASLNLGINVPLASSMGRLFDGIASILGIRDLASYEGQGAILLEASASCSENAYGYEIEKSDILRFDYRPMIRTIAADVQSGKDKADIAAAFMNTLVNMALDIVSEISERTELKNVVLSGGSFQNMFILKKLTKRLKEKGFEVYTHSRVSCNDEGLSLGQLMIGERYVSGTASQNNKN